MERGDTLDGLSYRTVTERDNYPGDINLLLNNGSHSRQRKQQYSKHFNFITNLLVLLVFFCNKKNHTEFYKEPLNSVNQRFDLQIRQCFE